MKRHVAESRSIGRAAFGVVAVMLCVTSGWSVPVPSASETAAPPGGSEYALTPRQTFVAPGGLCTLSVFVDTPGDSLGCIECRVTFDTTLVTLVDAEEGQVFKNSGEPGLFFWDVVATDTHSVEGCILGYRTYTLAPGEVARFVFRADAPGVCPVRITRLRLWDIDRVEFSPNVDPYAWIVIDGATGVSPTREPGLRLEAYPNPFNPATTLELSGLTGETAEVTVYEVSGRLVKRLFRGKVEAETARFLWDGRDDEGRRVASGLYFGVASVGNERRVRKLVLLQ